MDMMRARQESELSHRKTFDANGTISDSDGIGGLFSFVEELSEPLTPATPEEGRSRAQTSKGEWETTFFRHNG